VSDRLVTEEDWAADMLHGTESSSAPPTETRSDDEFAESDSGSAESSMRTDGVELDLISPHAPLSPDVNAGAKRTAVVLGMGVVCAIGVIAATLLTSRDTPPPPPIPSPVPVLAPAPATPTTPVTSLEADHVIAYTASATCPAGSTSAQALTDTTSDSAWVCVRGGQGAAVDGQVLRIDFPRSYVFFAVSVTPGWVAKTPGGKDEWLQHRVVSRLQYMFNDTDRTIVTQDTANTHGPVTTALPKKVMASAVTVVILQTARPPTSPLPTAGPDALGLPGFGDSLLGPDGTPLSSDATATTEPQTVDEQDNDPVDATFAMSELKFLGHEPN
jgi:hypothetical protein